MEDEERHYQGGRVEKDVSKRKRQGWQNMCQRKMNEPDWLEQIKIRKLSS